MLTDLKGQIERLTYYNEETGYTIAQVKVTGQSDLVTIVGNLISPLPGEVVHMQGNWISHPRFGDQFKVVQYRTAVPATVYGIRKYLGSGLIKGIGPVMAKRIVNRFGEDTLTVIEKDIERLGEVGGIGKKRMEMIRKAWADQKEIREVMVFLQSHGVGSGYAVKIFRQYGNSSIPVVTQNPYQLATDIFGIGFRTADRIAEKLGFEKKSPVRVKAGIIYVLHRLSDEGHVYFPYEPLIAECRKILDVDRADVEEGMTVIESEKRIVMEDIRNSPEEDPESHKAVFLEKFHFCENGISRRLKRLIHGEKTIRRIQEDKALDWVQQQLSITLAPMQMEAIRKAIRNKVMVITGGPGTGKTTIINAVLKIFSRLPVKILLAAPTGRAAKRMSETTGHKSKTIHRLLEFSMGKGGFQKDEDHPLACDLLVVDEASMIDTVLMHHLLKAVPLHATLILVGDVNQLPSVGAGNVLNDIIASETVAVVTLNEIFRQARKSRIIVNAHQINNGMVPYFDPASSHDDFYFIEQEDPEKVLDIILRLVANRIPERFGFHSVDDIQVLTPMHRGIVGAGNLNRELQKTLNREERGVVRGNRNLLVNDKVMQIRNNYEKEVFNGDIGRIRSVSLERQEVVICFDGRNLVYDFNDLDEIVPAYAISVHKSQGSEYPVVVIPVLVQHYMLLQRNLIYTAVTRGKKLVVMVGTRKALAMGIKNDKTRKRFTRLKYRLAR
ncbi:MAG: ATP-dependent RecD-like DNA helicase [Desulfobacteraceae bacterium]|nr:MAG: ATP-dependent RecD-like DNA helicase [Desulfobacteraceae bacterium]